MDVFSPAELAFLAATRTPARLAIAHPDGTPAVIPVEWSLGADQQSIELERTELLRLASMQLDRVTTVALVIDVVQPSGRWQGLQLTGPVEHHTTPHLTRVRPERVVAWGFEDAPDDTGQPRSASAKEAGRHGKEGSTSPGPMVAVVRRSAYDPDALARGQAQMARFERTHAAQPGYAGNVVVDLGDGERFVITLWASEEHAAAAREALGPVVRELLGPLERASSRLLGVGPVITTDLVLASANTPTIGQGTEQRPPGGDAPGHFQPDPAAVTWRMHFRSPPSAVYAALTTDEGRASFWAQRTAERGDAILFEFPGGLSSQARILETQRDRLFRIEYFNAVVSFELAPTEDRGTDLLLTTHGFAPEERMELTAGWLNVLFPLKAHVDHDVDLRNHDSDRTWWHGYADQ